MASGSGSTENDATGQSSPKERCKIFNDPIHGHIEVDALSVKIIDTPQFQRLRFIKQLGGGYWVYPGACHNRFEHSLGVYFLAGCLVTKLQKDQPELGITENDLLCVKIAGLCHDLGHGPFSHVFDQQFIPQAIDDCKWKHEQGSTDMLDYLIKENKIDLGQYSLTAEDLTFIKELINPPKALPSGDWQFKGRTQEKSFLYQIVSNEQNGMDVDKYDYFARDCHYTGLAKMFDHMQLIQHARVIKVDGKLQICYRKKDWPNVYNLFQTRAYLHRQAYQHRAKVAVEMMITDGLLAADGQNNKKISGAITDMEAYTNLTDSVFQQILDDERLEKARDILQNLEKRMLYRCVYETHPKDWYLFKEDDPKNIAEQVAGYADKSLDINAEDIGINIVKVNYGKGEKNPIENVRFWKKDTPNEAEPLKRDELSQMLPSKFEDRFLRVYCKKQDKESIEAVRSCFETFLDKKREMKKIEEEKMKRGMTTPIKQGSEKTFPPATPFKEAPTIEAPGNKGKANRKLNL